MDSINKMRGCKTSKCDGNLVPIFVRSVGLGGGIHIRFGCNGCRSKQVFLKPLPRTNLPKGQIALASVYKELLLWLVAHM